MLESLLVENKDSLILCSMMNRRKTCLAHASETKNIVKVFNEFVRETD